MSPVLSRLRVFISSPGDLKAEREAAERVVRTVAKHPLYQPYYAIEAELYEDAVPAAIGGPPLGVGSQAETCALELRIEASI